MALAARIADILGLRPRLADTLDLRVLSTPAWRKKDGSLPDPVPVFLSSPVAPDLERVKNATRFGPALTSYLREPEVPDRLDGVRSEAFALARWPSDTGKPLAVSQHFAVNTILKKAAIRSPGTRLKTEDSVARIPVCVLYWYPGLALRGSACKKEASLAPGPRWVRGVGLAWEVVPVPRKAAAPVVSSVSPASGTIGAEVAITGRGFAGASGVRFAAAASEFSVKSSSEITATVPAGASTGPVTVTGPGGTASSPEAFTVTPGIALSVVSGPPTTTVTVAGAGFGAFEAVDLYFDITDAALASTSGTGNFAGTAVQVPASALPGTADLTAVGRHSGLSAQAEFLVSTSWAQYRYASTHHGVNPYENVLSMSNVSGLDVAWSFPTGGSVQCSPAVADGVVYVGSDDSNVYALNAATGAKAWSFRTGNSIFSSPAVADGVVYVGSEDGNVYALDAATGAKAWSFPTENAVSSSPAVADGVVYVGSQDGNVYALDAATGDQAWTFRTGAPVIYSSPAVADGVVYVGSQDGNVYALDAATGAKAWSFPTENAVDSAPAVADGVVYVGSQDGNVYALDAATGAKAWSFPTGDVVDTAPAVADGVVYVGSGNNNVYALDAATGAKAWSFPTGAPVTFSSPAVADGAVYVGSNDGKVYSFTLAGGVAPP